MEKLDGREFKGVRVVCVADVCTPLVITKLDNLTGFRLNPIFQGIELGHARLRVDLTRLMKIIDEVPLVATVHAEMDIVTEAHLAVATMMTTVGDMVALLQDLVDQLTITHHRAGVGLMILIDVITPLRTLMSMVTADHHMIDLLQGTTFQEMPDMLMTIADGTNGDQLRL